MTLDEIFAKYPDDAKAKRPNDKNSYLLSSLKLYKDFINSTSDRPSFLYEDSQTNDWEIIE